MRCNELFALELMLDLCLLGLLLRGLLRLQLGLRELHLKLPDQSLALRGRLRELRYLDTLIAVGTDELLQLI